PSPSWPGSHRCSPTKATTPSATASYAATSEPNRTSTSAASRTAPAWGSGAGRLSAATPGCWRTNASPCVTTASASSSKPCSRPLAYSWLQENSPGNRENYLLESNQESNLSVVGGGKTRCEPRSAGNENRRDQDGDERSPLQAAASP